MKQKFIAILVVIIIVCGGILAATKSHYDQQVELLYTMLENQDSGTAPEVLENSQETESFHGKEIEAELRQVGRMETAEYYYTAVESYDSSKTLGNFKIPGTTSRYIYSYDGRIIAGIEADRICIEVNEDTKRVDIYLPEAEIISSEIYEDSFKLYDEKNSIFNPISVEDFNQSNQDMKAKEERKAIDKGLLTEAENNGVALMEAFARTLPIPETYTVTVVIDRSGTHTIRPAGGK